MIISCKKREAILPGDEVYVKAFKDGPFIYVQQGDEMVVDTIERDPADKSIFARKSSIRETCIVRTKKGEYHQLPRTILTRERPVSYSKQFSSNVVSAFFYSIVTISVIHVVLLLATL